MKKPAYSPRFLHSTSRYLPRLFMLAFIALLASAPMVKAEAAQYQPVECQSPEPRGTQVWKNFEKFVNEEYANKRRLNGEVLAVALGHALGRVALAQHDDLSRQQAVDCLQRGIAQVYAATSLVYYSSEGEAMRQRLRDLLREASWGLHDDLVKEYTGVTSTSPAYGVLGVSGPPPKSPWQPPITPTPSYPVYPPNQPQNPQVPPEIEYCNNGAYSGYSVAKAKVLIAEAENAEKYLPPDCYSTTNYLACQKVSGLLYSAIDQLTQVLLVSRSPVGEGCRYCDLKVHGYSSLGKRIDQVSMNLYNKGYRSAPSPDEGWHYSMLEKEDLCQRPPSPGFLSISPVSRADCPKHCDDAAPKCNYAYYVEKTRTCSWQDGQAAPNLHALETADIWDRANRRWLPRSSVPTPPQHRVFVLKDVVFSKYQTTSDLCGANKTCKHEKRVIPGNITVSGTEREDYYSIASGSATYRRKETLRSGGEVLSNYSVNFTFDAPPSSLRPGDVLRLRTQGNAIGFIDKRGGGGLNRTFSYYIKRNPKGSGVEFDKTRLVLKSGELPIHGDRRKGQLSKSSTTEITIPKDIRKELIIAGKAGWEPALHIEWIYEEQ